MRDKVISILKSVEPGIDYDKNTELITGKYLDSIDMMQIIEKIEDEFDVEIDMEYMDNQHFDSVDKMVNMIEELK